MHVCEDCIYFDAVDGCSECPYADEVLEGLED